jgi:hypothetical protein
LLDIGHLNTGRRVDAVGGQDERGQQHRIHPRFPILGLNDIPDGIDAFGVVRLKEPGAAGEGFGEVPGHAVDRVEPIHRRNEFASIDGGAVELEIALAEYL